METLNLEKLAQECATFKEFEKKFRKQTMAVQIAKAYKRATEEFLDPKFFCFDIRWWLFDLFRDERFRKALEKTYEHKKT